MNSQTLPSDNEAKQALIETGRLLYEKGLVAAANGNMSCRVADDALWTTPSGVAKGALSEDMLVKVRLDGTVASAGTPTPSSEVKMHLCLYRENPEINAVVHAHPPAATSFALAGVSLEEPLYPEAVVTLGVVPCVAYETPGSQELADALAPYCSEHTALLLANHGAVTWGGSLKEAFFRMETLEQYAHMLLNCKQLALDPRALNDRQVDELLAHSGRQKEVETCEEAGAAATKFSPQRNLLDIATVSLDDENSALILIDQTRLPNETVLLTLTKQEDIFKAIATLQVRGAPAIGCAAAIGLYLAAKENNESTYERFSAGLRQAREYLASSRPTAVNLFWALDRMERVVVENSDKTPDDIKPLLKAEALKILDEDVHACKAIGEHGLSLLTPGDGILTHCNAGQLATVRYGTALAPLHLGHERGYAFKVFACETRPLLQGARLTAFELKERGIDVTLICDSMASQVMKNGWVQAILVGADRIAANGDACNKIGTSALAILARHYGIPFYVCAPSSTIDLQTSTGNGICIEERPEREVTELWYQKRMAPEGIPVYNPAFDVVDNELITAIITEQGILRQPYALDYYAGRIDSQ